MSNNPFSLEGKRILVTGASSGIGRQTSKVLSELGAEVLLVGRDQDRLEESKSHLAAGAHKAYTFDLNATEEIPAWIKRIAGECGSLHGLVHSAGLHETIPIRVLSPTSIESLMRVNVVAGLMLLKGFRQKGVGEGDRSAVFISSVAGLKGEPAISAYSTSKAALIGMVRSTAMELAKEKIRVNCIAPSVVVTEMVASMREKLGEEHFAAIEARHPLGLGKPEDIAYSIGFLLSDAARWITGTTMVVDGGYTAQ